MSQCSDCGLVQISKKISPVELKPRFDWITYNEQEGHLDDLVDKVCQLSGLTTASTIGAISFKDDSTITRFRKRGFGNTWRLQIEKDLGINDHLAGLETIQSYLKPAKAREMLAERGLTDVLIVRHILEHAHEPKEFLAALRELVKPGGYFVFEVPDCTPALERGDYTMYWEEHVSCFTPGTFQQGLIAWGFSPVEFERYIYSNENSLVAIVQAGSGSPHPQDPAAVQQGRKYSSEFSAYRINVNQALENERKHGKVAVFGAGHLSCAWINFLGIEKHIEFVVDDHPRKKGMFMPGSRLPIRSSSDLLEQDIRLCLLSLSPESEIKVIQKNQAYLEAGGQFASIFPGKQNSFVGRL